MRILVTGGAGFIGSTFVRHVLATRPDVEVVVLDALTYAGNLENLESCRQNPRFSFWYGNITNADLVYDLVHKVDAVFHFAAESHVARSIYDNSLFFTTDVIGTQTVANAVTKSDRVRVFVHISTSEVYGTALSEPMDEDHPLNPLSPYAGAKAGADRLVYSYRAAYDIPAVIVRPLTITVPTSTSKRWCRGSSRAPLRASPSRSTATAQRCVTGYTWTTPPRPLHYSSITYRRRAPARCSTSAQGARRAYGRSLK